MEMKAEALTTTSYRRVSVDIKRWHV